MTLRLGIVFVSDTLQSLESAKSRVLRAHVPTCLAWLRVHVSTFFTCSRVNVSCVLTCSRANVPCVLPCKGALRAFVLTCPRANVLCVLTCSRVLRGYVQTCLSAHGLQLQITKISFQWHVLLRFMVLFLPLFSEK